MDFISAKSVVCVLIAGALWTWRNSLPLAWTLHIIFISLWSRWAATPSSSALKDPTKVTRSSPQLLLSRLPTPGQDIFDDVFTSSEYVATIDECDFNGHLSNSSYAKRLDFARSEMASKRFLRGGLDGSWVALGGTSFRYHAEIPMGAKYRVKMRIVTWDEKWCYLEAKYVSRSRKVAAEEKLHCVAIAKLCVKSGRKTIPPWFFFALCGYAPNGSSQPSHNWEKAEDLRVQLFKQAQKDARSQSLPRDSWFSGGGYSKAAGIFKFYVPLAKSPVLDTTKTVIRKPWMNRDYWDVDRWEERRQGGLRELASLTLFDS